MPPYVPLYEVGSKVEIADPQSLREFVRAWRLHNPLRHEQLA